MQFDGKRNVNKAKVVNKHETIPNIKNLNNTINEQLNDVARSSSLALAELRELPRTGVVKFSLRHRTRKNRANLPSTRTRFINANESPPLLGIVKVTKKSPPREFSMFFFFFF